MLAVQEIWPWGEVASVEEVESRLTGRWPANLVEAAIWKLLGDSAAMGHLLVDLEQHTLDRKLFWLCSHLMLDTQPYDAGQRWSKGGQSL